ncbi:hypothetical protein QFC19_006306 [Naganishia cerealis]|uniref:Uncharacterized protein n=1 Tax=Naganishia cerealis TaxID=610337 RepID=A0ACC2VHI9_9TREE|nr:hypothetical protein QFC19_006306 [Naganishia cerealis]
MIARGAARGRLRQLSHYLVWCEPYTRPNYGKWTFTKHLLERESISNLEAKLAKGYYLGILCYVVGALTPSPLRPPGEPQNKATVTPKSPKSFLAGYCYTAWMRLQNSSYVCRASYSHI